MTEMKMLKRFSQGVLEHISKIIGEYKAASEIAELLRITGYPEKSMVVGTKWRYLCEVFTEFNNKPGGQYYVAKIVQAFSDPTQWIGRELDWKQVLDKLNAGLIYVGLQLNKDGKFVTTRRKISHVAKKVPPEESLPPKLMIVDPVFRAREVKSEHDLCFVLMPFKPSFDRLYKEKIQPTIEACGLKCLRADDLFHTTPILEDIWIHICKSKAIIADVTGRNPNVFYEIGIAHTVGKPVIIITQDKEDVPFDLAHVRYFLYSDDDNGWNKLCSSITSALKSAI